MDENTGMILNLFLIELWFDNVYPDARYREPVDEENYRMLTDNSIFKTIKDCFPEDEICINYKVETIDSRYNHNYIRSK